MRRRTSTPRALLAATALTGGAMGAAALRRPLASVLRTRRGARDEHAAARRAASRAAAESLGAVAVEEHDAAVLGCVAGHIHTAPAPAAGPPPAPTGYSCPRAAV